jgi:hypothetical protein
MTLCGMVSAWRCMVQDGAIGACESDARCCSRCMMREALDGAGQRVERAALDCMVIVRLLRR